MYKTIAVLAILISLVYSNTHPHLDPIITHIPKTYKVNLQDSAMIRWAPIIAEFKQPLSKFMHYFNMLPIPESFFKDVQWFAHNEFKYQDFVAQVDAVSKLSGYPFDKLFFINFMYQFSTIKACTGVIVRNDQGKIIHGRNLDFSMWELLSNLVANIQYYKGGKLLFTVDTIVGSVFTLTANKPGSFSVQVNTRTQQKFQDDFISILAKNAMPTCWLLRKVVQQESTFENAIKRLQNQRVGGPVYFVVSGMKGNEGIVIQKDNNGIHASYSLNDTNWFIVQTNYDRNIPDPVHDYRRIPAQNKLKQRGNKNFKQQDLFDVVMSQFPTLNLQTILTVVMVSATGYHNTTVWYGQNPKTQSLSLE